jgi:structural maintenance of chromosome 2
LADEQAKLTAFDDELQSLEEAKRSKKALIAEEGLEQQRIRHEIEKFHKDRETAAQRLKALAKEHDWVEEESGRFGRPGTDYDFQGKDIDACKADCKQLQERSAGMKTKINPKVMATIDATEKREASVKKRMAIVKKDKKKIEETVEKLNKYKNAALEKAWTKVNSHFGLIFNELLPGSFAKLEAPEGKTIADGLEIKVQLGKVWKESLNELSGGQRYVVFSVNTNVRNPNSHIGH